MKGDVRTLATEAKGSVLAYSMAVVFSALVYIGSFLLAAITSVLDPDDMDIRMGQKQDFAGVSELST
jgi:hypothetical protein